MLRHLQLRLLLTGPTLLGVFSLSFLLFRVLPGDPVTGILGEYATAQAREAMRRELGLDQPLAIQYAQYLGRVTRGDFGTSLVTRRPALDETLRALPFSLALTAAGLMLATLIGVPLGLAAAVRPGSWLDYAATGVTLTGTALPAFWVAQVALLVFSSWLGLFPAVHMGDTSGPLDTWRGLALPATVLGTSMCAPLARLTRAAMLDALGQPYITVARARGLGEWSVSVRHSLRSVLPPLFAAAGGLLAWGLGNAVMVEAVFARPGLGSLLVTAATARDYPLVQAGLAVVAVGILLTNSALDLLYRLADPRLR